MVIDPLVVEGNDMGGDWERRLNFLILTMPAKEIISVSFREGIDFIDEPWPEFGNFLILETA